MSDRSGAGELLAHLAGDYLVQTHGMAVEKTSRWAPALVHAATYTACFLPVTRSWRALAVIGGTHAVIDRYRLARHLIWAKNQAAPAWRRYPWSHGSETGYHTAQHEASTPARMARGMNVPLRIVGLPAECTEPAMPDWLAVWLMIVTDNTAHLLLNRLALRLWGGRG